ncbi:hypothetical protein HNV11_04905 [Spirosoma taeanense]|uniref:Uncharacterized protein n=1 Tax=Spirosoma taeanense TaxID=2735870 RepID=A0A6M5Y5U0_9BACT|nr:hypothetical protein [Spirosoma taeanense]QJW88766.1 hypothetical protein HNV11_04905 [Spirosoma taeanense]
MRSSKEIATNYLERFVRLCESTNKFILIGLTVLFGNWIAVVESHYSDYEYSLIRKREEKAKVQTKLTRINKQINTVDKAVAKLTENREKISEDVPDTSVGDSVLAQSDTKQGQLANLNERIKKLQDSLSQLNVEKQKKQSTVSAIGNQIAQLTSKSFDGTPFGLLALFVSRPREGAVVLGVLLLSVLIYVYVVRRNALRLAGRLIRLCDSDQALKLLPADDILVSSPLWLAPAPVRDGTGVCANRLKEMLGWGGVAQNRRLQLALVFLIILFWQIRLTFITIKMNVINPADMVENTLQYGTNLLVSVSLFITLLSALLMILWVAGPWPVEDAYNHEPNSSRISRSEFIGVASTMVVTILLGIFASTSRAQLLMNGHLPRSRYRKQIKYVWRGNTGLYTNRKSGKQHWMEKKKNFSLSLSIKNASDYEKFAKSTQLIKQAKQVNFDALPKKQVAIYCERMALGHLFNKDVSTAFTTLIAGVIRASPAQAQRLVGLMRRVRAKYQDEAPVLFNLLQPYKQNEVINSLLKGWDSEYLTLPQRVKGRWTWDGQPI